MNMHGTDKLARVREHWRIGHGRFTRDVDGARYAELFLVSSISSVIVIRSFLALTGYPQMGNSTLHIAHMLYGGLFMLVALLLLLLFYSRVWKGLAAVLGGIGFGTFIDELGKFITSDNDYFFQPTISLIYVIFMGIFLATRAVSHHADPTIEEKLIFGLAAAQAAVLGTLDEAQRRRALRYLDECDASDPATASLRTTLVNIPARPDPVESVYQRARRGLATLYQHTISQRVTQLAIAILFVLYALSSVLWFISPEARDEAHTNLISTGGAVFSGIFNLLGAVRLRHSRYEAFRWFERSVLISIFVTQVFLFDQNGLIEIFTLAFNLLLLGALKFALSEEHATDGAQTNNPANEAMPSASPSRSNLT
jgi:hypothetical protein